MQDVGELSRADVGLGVPGGAGWAVPGWLVAWRQGRCSACHFHHRHEPVIHGFYILGV